MSTISARRPGVAARVVAVVALAVAASACGSSDSDPSPPQTSSPPAPTQGPVDLSKLIIPAGSGHPAKGKVFEATFQEAASSGLLAPPEGMTFAPDTCVNFIELGDPATLNGWMQYNEASPVGKQHNLAHKDFYVGTIFQLPQGVDLEKIRLTALSCDAGSVTLQGDDNTTVTGTLTNTEVDDAIDLPGAATFEMTQRLQFEPTTDPDTNAILTQYYGELDPAGGVLRIKQIILVNVGDILLLVNMQDMTAARQLATDFRQRAEQHGLL